MAGAVGEGFEIETAQAGLYVGQVVKIADRVEAVRSTAMSVVLGAQAYGVLCQMIPALVAPVQASCVDALDAATGSLEKLATAVRQAVNNYQQGDRVAAKTYDSGVA